MERYKVRISPSTITKNLPCWLHLCPFERIRRERCGRSTVFPSVPAYCGSDAVGHVRVQQAFAVSRQSGLESTLGGGILKKSLRFCRRCWPVPWSMCAERYFGHWNCPDRSSLKSTCLISHKVVVLDFSRKKQALVGARLDPKLEIPWKLALSCTF